MIINNQQPICLFELDHVFPLRARYFSLRVLRTRRITAANLTNSFVNVHGPRVLKINTRQSMSLLMSVLDLYNA